MQESREASAAFSSLLMQLAAASFLKRAAIVIQKRRMSRSLKRRISERQSARRSKLRAGSQLLGSSQKPASVRQTILSAFVPSMRVGTVSTGFGSCGRTKGSIARLPVLCAKAGRVLRPLRQTILSAPRFASALVKNSSAPSRVSGASSQSLGRRFTGTAPKRSSKHPPPASSRHTACRPPPSFACCA